MNTDYFMGTLAEGCRDHRSAYSGGRAATLADESAQQGIERDHRDAGNHVGRGEW